jgi:hypothetical protein
MVVGVVGSITRTLIVVFGRGVFGRPVFTALQLPPPLRLLKTPSLEIPAKVPA